MVLLASNALPLPALGLELNQLARLIQSLDDVLLVGRMKSRYSN